MVKLTGPGNSHYASGKLAASLIFSKSAKGAYLKAFAKPKQPRTDAQIAPRAMTKFLSQVWSTLTDAQKATWQHSADVLNLAPYHAFLKENQLRWRTFRTPTQEFPAAEATIPVPPSTWRITLGYREVINEFRNPLGFILWGYILYRQHNALYVPSLTTVKSLTPTGGTPWTKVIDSPVPPGDYRYMRSLFNVDGVHAINTQSRTVRVT